MKGRYVGPGSNSAGLSLTFMLDTPESKQLPQDIVSSYTSWDPSLAFLLISEEHIIIQSVSEVQLRNIRRTRCVWNLPGKGTTGKEKKWVIAMLEECWAEVHGRLNQLNRLKSHSDTIIFHRDQLLADMDWISTSLLLCLDSLALFINTGLLRP